jgi:DNA mismatch repair ATPase MutL
MGWLDLPFQVTSPTEPKTSRYGWGNEGKKTEGQQSRKTVDEKAKGKESVQGDGQSKNTKKENEGKASKGTDKSFSESQEKTGSEESESSKTPANDSKKQASKDEKQEQPNGQEPSPSSEQAKQREDEDGAKQESSTESKSNRSESKANQPPPSSNFSFSLAGGLSNLIGWLLVIVLLATMIYWIIKFRSEFAKLWSDLLKWWENLFGVREKNSPARSADVREAKLELKKNKSFAEFENPFASHRLSMNPAQIIQHTFAAIEAWGSERGLTRQAEETPQEFLQRLLLAFPEQQPNFQSLSFLYNRLAYAGGKVAIQEVKPLQSLWAWLVRRQ